MENNEEEMEMNHEPSEMNVFDNIGLPNPGTNLCYVNSTVQGLLSCDIIKQFINAGLEDRFIAILGSITKGTLTTTETLRSDYLPTTGNDNFNTLDINV